jgi:hypothetical protein
MTNAPAIAPATVSVEQAGHILGLSRNGAYAAAARGDIPTVRIGRKVLVPHHRLLALLDGDEPSNRIRRRGEDWHFREVGEWRVLRDPHGPATDRQLAWLERKGLLPLPRPITKLEAAHAIDRAIRQEPA